MVFMVLLLAGVWAAHVLELHAGDLVPSKGGLEKAGKFFRAALHPSLYSEDPQHADVALWPEALEAARLTVVYSAAAVGLSVILGLFLGFLGSTAWSTKRPSRSFAPLRMTFECGEPLNAGSLVLQLVAGGKL
jgi:ABC-type phosphate/phosphonate transport system permease subunit